jgi:lysophospholipase L1-like esterase
MTTPPETRVEAVRPTAVHPSPTTARRRHQFPVALLVAVLVVVAGEGAVRAFASRLDPPLRWQNWEAQNKVARMDDLAARGGASVVFMGSSTVNAAADPLQFARLRPSSRPPFNAALNGADARLDERWLLDVVVPRLRPDVVVLGISSRDLNDNASHRQLRLYLASAAGRRAMGLESLTDRFERRAEELSYLVRYRTTLRRPSQVWRGGDRFRDAARVAPLGQLFALRIYANAPYTITSSFRAVARRDSLHRFAVGGEQTAALRRVVARLRAQGVDVVLVTMPITVDGIALHPEGPQDYERFRTVRDRLVAETGVRSLDLTPEFPSTKGFFDPFHLNGAGRARFTEALASRL